MFLVILGYYEVLNTISEIWRIAFQENEKHLCLPFMTGSFSLTLMVTM